MSIALHLRYLWHATLTPDQPPHAHEIENADPEPVPHAVIRNTGAARTVDHVHIADAVAFASNERGQEPMQPVEIRQRQEQIASKRLEPAAGVAGTVAQYRAAYSVGDARLEFLEAGILAPDPLPGDEA